jgi:hypothetical protein
LYEPADAEPIEADWAKNEPNEKKLAAAARGESIAKEALPINSR